MMADVPFGVFLSGGVDSSTNVALMSELMTDPVRTFSVAFKDYDRYNELQYAREIAQRFGADHHEVVIDWNDLESFLPEMIFHQDEPIADWVCVPLHYVAARPRQRHDRGPGRRGLRRAVPRLRRLHQRGPVPAAVLGAVPARAGAAPSRDRPGGDRTRAARRPGGVHALGRRGGGGTASVLGRGDLLPGRDQGASDRTQRARRPTPTRSSSGSGAMPSETGRTPTCSRR